MSGNPIEEAATEENYEKQYFINILSEHFKLNHNYGRLLNTNRKILSTDQSINMALTTNRELTNEFAPPKKFIPGVESKDLTRERTQAIKFISTNYNLIDKTNLFDFIDLKMEKVMYDYHQGGANKKITDIIDKRDRSPETHRLVEKRKEFTKPGNLRFNFFSIVNRKVWVPRKPDKKERRGGSK